MICPFLAMADCSLDYETLKSNFSDSCGIDWDCQAENCAWFDKKKGQCAILTLAQSSYSLKDAIQVLGQQISTKR